MIFTASNEIVDLYMAFVDFTKDSQAVLPNGAEIPL